MAFRCLSFRRTAWYLTPSLMRGSDRLLPIQHFQELSDPAASSSRRHLVLPSLLQGDGDDRVHFTEGEKQDYLQVLSLPAREKWSKETAKCLKIGYLHWSRLSQQWREPCCMDVSLLLLDLALNLKETEP